jgi:hypothetical protein
MSLVSWRELISRVGDVGAFVLRVCVRRVVCVKARRNLYHIHDLLLRSNNKSRICDKYRVGVRTYACVCVPVRPRVCASVRMRETLKIPKKILVLGGKILFWCNE